jgi:hypothetical protein
MAWQTQDRRPTHLKVDIARTLLRDHREVYAKVLNATRGDQKLTKTFPLAHLEPVTLVTPTNVGQQFQFIIVPKIHTGITTI